MTDLPPQPPCVASGDPGSLVDRYVWAATRSLPERQRDDVERELRGSIADAVDARVGLGVEPGAAEHAVLVELGDPARLAAQYADRPRYLIGPVLYFDYLRLLRLLAAIALPTATAATALGLVVSGAGVGETIGTVAVTALSVAVHLGFWTTLVFAIVERTGAARSLATTWTPDSLPELPRRGSVRLADVIAPAVLLAVLAGAIVWQHFFSALQDAEGRVIPLLAPGLWSFWLPYLLGVAVLELLFALVLYRVGRWTVPFAIVNLVLAAAAAVPIAWLFANGLVVNPDVVARLGIAGLLAPDGVLTLLAVVLTIGIAIWDVVDGVLKTVRDRRVAAP